MSTQTVLKNAAAEANTLAVFSAAAAEAKGSQALGQLDQLLSNAPQQVIDLATDLNNNLLAGLASQNSGKNMADSLKDVDTQAKAAKLSRMGILAATTTSAAPEETPVSTPSH
jgi:hypothetical protein